MTREEKISQIAEAWTDDADLDALLNLYYEFQYQYLEERSDEELSKIYEEICK